MSFTTEPLNTQEWPASNFSKQYRLWITHKGHEKKRNDHQPKEFLIAKHILLHYHGKSIENSLENINTVVRFRRVKNALKILWLLWNFVSEFSCEYTCFVRQTPLIFVWTQCSFSYDNTSRQAASAKHIHEKSALEKHTQNNSLNIQ